METSGLTSDGGEEDGEEGPGLGQHAGGQGHPSFSRHFSCLSLTSLELHRQYDKYAYSLYY